MVFLPIQETKMVFEKLYKFIGKNIKNLIDRQDEAYCFRLHKNRVFYVRESIMKKATNVRGQCRAYAAATNWQRLSTLTMHAA